MINKIKYKCKHCKANFEGYINRKFCNRTCANLGRDSRKLGIYRPCGHCKKEMYVARWEHNKKKYCSRYCKSNNPEAIERAIKTIKQVDTKGKNNGRYIDGRWIYRKAIFSIREHLCEICGEDDENKLVIHHKDCDRRNNNERNLIIVCYSCHNLIHKISRKTKNEQETIIRLSKQVGEKQ